MDVLFYLAPSLILGLALFMAYRVVRRWLQIRAAWKSGLTAQGRCLRMFTTTDGGGADTSASTTLHHVYEFTTHDGRCVRFEEEDGPAIRLEGDPVTVYYTDGPAVVATAHEPGQRGQAVRAGCLLFFLALVVAFCVVFMVTYTEVFLNDDMPGF
ncbi:DUF3592 domain-containing protein [Streptomyces sp. NPDC101225]|uniref:DUF3592 domain-containing protein n=1 Tax=Streptomyces sp. NPDC101225 TaxID=3366135 RepID=UPI0038079771